MRYSGLRYIFDREGRRTFMWALCILVCTAFSAWMLFRVFGVYAAVVALVLGTDIACSSLDRAIVGSVYRQRMDKLQELYLKHKKHFDERFAHLHGGSPGDGSSR